MGHQAADRPVAIATDFSHIVGKVDGLATTVAALWQRGLQPDLSTQLAERGANLRQTLSVLVVLESERRTQPSTAVATLNPAAWITPDRFRGLRTTPAGIRTSMTTLDRAAAVDGWPESAVGPVRLADRLGWASAALGAPMLLTPRRLLVAAGVRPDARAAAITAGVGIREFAATGTILGLRHRRVGAWSRVLGDTMDLALLGAAWRSRRAETPRLIGATAFVAAILGVDLLVALRLGRAEGTHIDDGSTSHGRGATPARRGGPAHVRTAITVQGSEDELRRVFLEFTWRAFDPVALERRGEIRFVAAPGDRGVEIHLDHDPSVPGGSLGATVVRLLGRSPDQKINDDLRRFKAHVETGVEIRSDKTPEPFSARRQMLQRPAQPVEASG